MDEAHAGREKLCPSHAAVPGAGLLGVVNARGGVDILAKPIPVNAAFLEGADLEKRFRFSGACVESRCAQWSAGGCGIGRMVAALDVRHEAASLRPCAIRGSCRWYAQEGAPACRNCHLVVTDRRN